MEKTTLEKSVAHVNFTQFAWRDLIIKGENTQLSLVEIKNNICTYTYIVIEINKEKLISREKESEYIYMRVFLIFNFYVKLNHFFPGHNQTALCKTDSMNLNISPYCRANIYMYRLFTWMVMAGPGHLVRYVLCG